MRFDGRSRPKPLDAVPDTDLSSAGVSLFILGMELGWSTHLCLSRPFLVSAPNTLRPRRPFSHNEMLGYPPGA